MNDEEAEKREEEKKNQPQQKAEKTSFGKSDSF